MGRAFRTVPDRTRITIEERDRGCRVPGCDRSRWLHVHHIRHWEDGGTTDTVNVIALRQHHHRLHHRGRLGITGNADDPDGVVFTDERGRTVVGCGRPIPPGDRPVPPGSWAHPSGERLDMRWVQFNEPRCTDRRVSAQVQLRQDHPAVPFPANRRALSPHTGCDIHLTNGSSDNP